MTVADTTIADLRERMSRLEGRPSSQPVATHPALAGLVDLRTGGVYSTSSASLLGLLMAGPSADGAWCGVVGTARLGVEALAACGVRLERCVWVPDPGPSWLEATAALADVADVVVVAPSHRVGEGEAARLAARLRKRGTILLAHGDWPRADARLRLGEPRWDGLGSGHGHLRARQVTVEVARGTAPPRTRRIWFPDTDARVHEVTVQAPSRALRSVG